MDWNRAKNLIIVFLFMLNVFLGVMYYTQHNKYVLTPEQESAIFAILSQSKINMYARIPKDYKPMRPIQMGGYEYDDEHLIRVFFDGNENVERWEEPNKTTFDLNGVTLVNQNGYITYDSTLSEVGQAYVGTNTSGHVESFGAAAALCEDFIKKLYDSPFVMEEHLQEGADYVLLYRNQYDNTVIQSNFISFRVSARGIIQVETMYSRPLGYKGRTQSICSADEALFTFMQQIKRVYGDKEIFVDKMEFVYYQDQIMYETGSLNVQEAQFAVPCYRISIWRQDIPEDVSVLINAYTNTVI